MFEQYRPLELECDAPCYAVVQACSEIGIQAPEDVRWCRLGNLFGDPSGWPMIMHRETWGMKPQCLCGAPLPEMQRYLFTFNTGKETYYLLGQCGRCRTVYWD
jgi:hypothetical protein